MREGLVCGHGTERVELGGELGMVPLQELKLPGALLSPSQSSPFTCLALRISLSNV